MALTDELLNYWKLDESSGNASDSVGSVTLTNSNVTYSSGKINNCAVFNSGTDKLTGTIADIDSYSDGWSISFWAYHNNTAIGREWLWQIGESSSLGTCFVGTWESPWTNLWFKFGNGETSFYGTNTSQSIPNEEWFHIVATVNGTSQKLYYNGSLVSNVTKTNTIRNNNTTLTVGNDSGNSYPWDGSVDEVGIWSRALSSDEVSTLYNSGNGLQYPFSTTSVKSVNGLAKASVKSKNGLAVASIKSFNGLA